MQTIKTAESKTQTWSSNKKRAKLKPETSTAGNLKFKNLTLIYQNVEFKLV